MIRDASSGIPLRAPPPGVVSDFVDPVFLGLPVLVTGGIALGLVVIFTAIRFCATILVHRRWKFDDYAYCFCCSAVLAMISFVISITLAKPNGYHAWDIDSDVKEESSSPVLQILVFSMALGPVVWLLKLTLFCSMLREFGYVRWIKNSAYAGIVITGLFSSIYTVVVALACGPRPNTDAGSYWSGFQRNQCSSPDGVNAIASIMFGVLNFASDACLVALPLSPVRSMILPAKQKIGVYTIVLSGLMMCACSLVGLVYRIESQKSTDFTGSQIPIYTAL
ncbi:hypothetical protein BCR34DRAFT_53300 [Clohesyomyces aquaticus]|uniref:Rhodopsin domain-containing protein n=1 Tax=Clohesyomyces aquaticus TaxID=1231657 RepID=A0A1Y1Z3W6_9PLEO|nr:hypothetical protein BCR34DRAFT_53300 [Clohesyomyces aquaticus]